ncbi:SH3-like domain-containing protein [Actinomadura viridis]|uniref:Nitrile hydratase n=1 Tax=Actinomadura viridis TaxID=58110 RepID=A0A931GM57_9ACTN|nr:SH3-like domain-containing protein [Actinomadura viridis]MBG6092823.1 nitrile hydratase [Actinomadura viridis]
MSRVHDMGGQQGFGPVPVVVGGEPPFHADWEARVFALSRALLGAGAFNVDEFRDAIESLPPETYLASSYYERWLMAMENLLEAKGLA